MASVLPLLPRMSPVVMRLLGQIMRTRRRANGCNTHLHPPHSHQRHPLLLLYPCNHKEQQSTTTFGPTCHDQRYRLLHRSHRLLACQSQQTRVQQSTQGKLSNCRSRMRLARNSMLENKGVMTVHQSTQEKLCDRMHSMHLTRDKILEDQGIIFVPPAQVLPRMVMSAPRFHMRTVSRPQVSSTPRHRRTKTSIAHLQTMSHLARQ